MTFSTLSIVWSLVDHYGSCYFRKIKIVIKEAGSEVGKTALSELGVSVSKLMLKRLYESGTN